MNFPYRFAVCFSAPKSVQKAYFFHCFAKRILQFHIFCEETRLVTSSFSAAIRFKRISSEK